MYNSIDLQMIPKLIQSFIQVMQKNISPKGKLRLVTGHRRSNGYSSHYFTTPWPNTVVLIQNTMYIMLYMYIFLSIHKTYMLVPQV